MIEEVYCDRKGCGKVVGARRIENNKVVEEEWAEGHCTEEEVDEEMNVIGTKHFCSIECANKKDEFVTPEEMEDDSSN